MNLPHGSNFCLCRTCGETFKNARAFDKHRKGPITTRRCLTNAEMLEAGLERNRSGYWRLSSSGNPWAAGAVQTHPLAETQHG
jgi:hypothetical protein